MPFSPLEKELRKHVKTYQEYNASTCTELFSTPSALEFHRFVASNRPVVIRGQGYRDQIPALERWTDEYLIEKMEEREVDISVDPTGNADSIVDGYFVEPANVKMPLSQLFSHLKEEEKESHVRKDRPVWYLQSQNGNLSDEYAPLLDDVGQDGPLWAREALGQSPDVANIWIGGGKSKTSMHKDPYENVYLVVRGSKDFILLPPSETYCLHEQTYPHASWSYSPPPSSSSSSSSDSFTLIPTTPRTTLPWIPIDPLLPFSAITSQYPRYSLARPIRVRLERGDMLYLPSCWFHHVSQTPLHHSHAPGSSSDRAREGDDGDQGVKAAIAVNWWFDMKFDGPFYSAIELNRRLVRMLDREEEEILRGNNDEGEEETFESDSESV